MMLLRSTRYLQGLQCSRPLPILVDTARQRFRGHTTSTRSVDSKGGDPNSLQCEEAMKITRLGMYANVAMAACKGTVGCAINSSALVADAVHSLSDLLSDVVTLWAVRISRLPPDDEHPYGYGKFEAVGSLTVGAILTAAGVGMGYDALHLLQTGLLDAAVTVPSSLDFSFLTTLDRTTQWSIAAGAAVASIGAKEALYHATVRVGNQTNSKVLIANAWHHRTDAISSVVALGGILGSMANVPLFDPIAGAIVSGMIAKTGVDICLDSVRELTDKSVENEVLDLLRHSSSSVEDVVSVSNVRARRMGPYTLVDLRVNVHGRTSVSAAQQVAARVKAEVLKRVPDVSEVLVHIDVANEYGDVDPHGNKAADAPAAQMRPFREIKQDVLHAVKAIPEILSITHVNVHWVVRRDNSCELGQTYGTDLDVTIVVHPDMAVREVHSIARRARREIERLSYVVTADIHLELYDEDVMVLEERQTSRSIDGARPLP
ncbi:hypothetical protein H310_13117 [Aphanomyces invadans]|uniref:Uncharacterized protein n=1 Tax=Aphanomyces invadans TaxID=157072 RepID=A0A024TH39_9STRA|nr:hypothetical protein H310_13117 [Aphanomyces invadans]ETV92677.1 hypothetical protein H310_13117 [Aphanomyces invadans]|eukprot:XP_008878713.1 hypothetical protein H310_13117 [Aphanomyces invadans]